MSCALLRTIDQCVCHTPSCSNIVLDSRAQQRHYYCDQCEQKLHSDAHPSPLKSPSPPPPSSPLSMFGRPSGCIDQLTLVERAAIVTLHGVGWSDCNIAKELHCDEHTVSRWIIRWQETRSLQDTDRSGRPRCTEDEKDQDIMLFSNSHHKALPRDIARELALPVSSRTVRRRLCEIDLHTYVQRHEHAFTELDLRRRLSFGEGYSPWTEAQWRRVLWSDHTLFTLDYQSREYVVRPPGHGCDEEFMEKERGLQGAIWLWGCICAEGLGHAEIYEGTLDALRYQRILALNLVKSAHTFWPSGHWYYQQDNASPHTAGTTDMWFRIHGIDLIDFPPARRTVRHGADAGRGDTTLLTKQNKTKEKKRKLLPLLDTNNTYNNCHYTCTKR